MRYTFALSIITFLSVIGIADSTYLSMHALEGTPLICTSTGIFSGCNAVAQSAYSHVFGIPLGFFGVFFYAVILVLSVSIELRASYRLQKLLLVFAGIGMALSVYFLGLQLFVISALCMYCLLSFVCAAGVLAATLSLFRHSKQPMLEPT